MAVVIIQSNDGHEIERITITNAYGPWTDDDTLDDIAWQINAALAYEEDEA